MSGGSYDYLFSSAYHIGDLAGKTSQLRRMMDSLRSQGFESEAKDTEAVLIHLMEAQNLAVKLSDVWRAEEWIRSGDSLPVELKDRSEEYRILKKQSWRNLNQQQEPAEGE